MLFTSAIPVDTTARLNKRGFSLILCGLILFMSVIGEELGIKLKIKIIVMSSKKHPHKLGLSHASDHFALCLET